MDSNLMYFLITMASIICVNSLFFIVMLAFAGTIAALQWYYSRKMHATLQKAISDTQAMLKSKATFKPLKEVLMKTFGAMMTNSGKNFKKWVIDAGGSEAMGGTIEKAFHWFGEAFGKTAKQQRKIKTAGKGLQAVMNAKKKAKKKTKVIEGPPAQKGVVAIDLSPKQQKEWVEAQKKILTKKQLEAAGLAEAGKKNNK